MTIVLSLQGCMAVGKSTALKYIHEKMPNIHISYEDHVQIIEEIKSRKLDKNRLEDYLEIQKLWIENEVKRWEKAQEHECAMMDFGAEEIEFYTINYPKTIGANWDIENLLKNELETLRKCMPNRILFLDANEMVLRERKTNDTTRSRTFFEYHLQHLLPLKREWFFNRENVDVLNVSYLNKEEVGEFVLKWIENLMTESSKKRY